MQTPDRQSKLAEIKLVSKYHPVGNYSYPRNGDGSVPMSPPSPTISRRDRCSVGSESSAPGLIDDRTDSEVSQEDDDYAQASELWNSFWRPGGEWRLEDAHQDVELLFSAKESKDGYAALIPCPQHRRLPSQKSVVVDENSPAWPLPKPSAPAPAAAAAPERSTSRKPVPTYSAFPSVRARPQSRSQIPPLPLSPRSPNMPTTCIGPPPRPERPAALLTPCLEQPAQVPVNFATKTPVIPPRRDSRPKTSSGAPPPRRGSKLTDVRFKDDANILGIHAVASRSSEDLNKMPSYTTTTTTTLDSHQPPRHYKSTTYLGAARQQQRLHQQQVEMAQLQPEPHSVFEEDSDCEESTAMSFFRFHKRSSSEKSYKGSTAGQESLNRRRRNRADTIPVSSTTKPASEKERKVDVFGRMLGRRSR